MKVWKVFAPFVICMTIFLCNLSTATAAEISSSPEPIYVAALTDQDLSTNLFYGTRVVIPEGTKYYASADSAGSGNYGTIGNRYTPMGSDLYIGGFAQLDASDRLTEYRAYNPSYVPVADHWIDDASRSTDWDYTWVVIFRNPDGNRPLGWVPARAIATVNGILGDGKTNAAFKNGVIITDITHIDDDEELAPDLVDSTLPDPGNMIEDRVIRNQDHPNTNDQTNDDPFISTREIAYAIEDYVENGNKVALLMDISASVSEYLTDISSYGAYIDKVNKADEIIAFGRDYKIISAEEYLTADINRGGTDIYTPLGNLTNVSSYDRIIIITDTYHNIFNASIPEISNFTGKIVIVCTGPLRSADVTVIENIETAFNTTTYLCRLSNELDRIQTIDALRRAS